MRESGVLRAPLLAIALLASCAEEVVDTSRLDDAPVRVTSWDLVASSRDTRLIPHIEATEQCDEPSGLSEFPAELGECTVGSDSTNWQCGEPVSCVDHVEIDGRAAGRGERDYGESQWWWSSDVALDTTVRLAGCGL